MNRYSINTFVEAVDRMRLRGWLYDVDQIAPAVLTQLHWAADRGELRRTQESWPLRGGGGVMRTMFRLVENPA